MAGTVVSGLVSGMDTQSLIAQLMKVEQAPQARLQSQQSALRSVAKAYERIEALVRSMKDSAGALAAPGGWRSFSATSTSSAVVPTVAAGADSMEGSVTFTVDRLATAASQASASAVSGTSAIVATGPLSITVNGTAHSVDVGDGSLASVVTAVNAAGIGVRAAAVQVSAGQYKLQLTATTTGAASSFAVGAGALDPSLGGLVVLDGGQDAQVTVSGGLVVQSAGNTVSGLIPGLSVSLVRADPATPVTVSVARDGAALADKVAALVSSVNAALAGIKAETGYDPTTKKAGVLLSDLAVRQFQQALVSTVPGSSGAGVKLTRDGMVSFDRAAFLQAYAADPAGVASLFQRGGTAASSTVTFVNAGDGAQAGAYAVNVTQAAAQASVTGSVLAGGVMAADETISVRVGTTVVSYAAVTGESAASVAAGLNASLAAAGGLGVSASVVGGALRLQSGDYGSGVSFEVQASGAASGLAVAPGVWEAHAGLDAAGTINGVAAVGVGQILTAPATDAVVPGLSLRATAVVSTTFTYAPGLAQRLSSLAAGALAPGTGRLEAPRQSKEDQARKLDDQIGQWDVRLALRQKALQAQFSNLETMLGRLRDQSNWLAGQLAGLSGSGNG